jgi:phosphoribosyl-ATP pyrophosphohydrolase/phosphoribosyl-AMP cyclohydrolase
VVLVAFARRTLAQGRNFRTHVSIAVDCDGDALVALVEPKGAACHTGAPSCFHHEIGSANKFAEGGARGESRRARTLGATLAGLYALIESRGRERPEGSYTTYLFDAGLDKILKKVGEESAETIIAAKNEDAPALVAEVSDLLYHLLVLLVARGVKLEEIEGELAGREEKRNAK